MIRMSARPWYTNIFPPSSLNRRRFGLAVLIRAKLGCSSTPSSYASASVAYGSAVQPLAPLPVALMNDGVASFGFCFSRATMSAAIVNGAAPAKAAMKVPRASPYQSWLPLILSDQLLSTTGGGAVPSRVCPYHILFIAWACTGVTQFGDVPFPAGTQSTLLSSVGSYRHSEGSGM